MKSTTVLLAALAVILPLQASTITFGSDVPGTTEGNNLDGTNFVTIPASAWHAPLGTSKWESTEVNSTNPEVPNGTLVDFFFTFDIVGTPTAGSLGILVDDSAEVILNGTQLADNLGSPQGTNCAASLPNCITPLDLNILPELKTGINKLDIWVEQDAGAQFGVDVYGTASSNSSGTPEPATLGLIGIGGIVLGLVRRKIR